MDALKADFKHQLGFQGSCRPEALQGVASDPAVKLEDFGIVEAGIGLGEGHQLRLFSVGPEAEGVIGEQVGASPTAGLGIEEYCVEGHRLQLVLPPVAALASAQIRRFRLFEHQAFGVVLTGLVALCLQLLPGVDRPGRALLQPPRLGMLDVSKQRSQLLLTLA